MSLRRIEKRLIEIRELLEVAQTKYRYEAETFHATKALTVDLQIETVGKKENVAGTIKGFQAHMAGAVGSEKTNAQLIIDGKDIFAATSAILVASGFTNTTYPFMSLQHNVNGECQWIYNEKVRFNNSFELRAWKDAGAGNHDVTLSVFYELEIKL